MAEAQKYVESRENGQQYFVLSHVLLGETLDEVDEEKV